ncbi:MAG: alkaline shock response membrane anchor protein AmaP [Candidatus Omnitrophota bacterium]
MRILGIIFYATILSLVGLAMVVFAFNKLESQQIHDLILYIQDSFSSRLIVGFSGLLLIMVTFSIAQMILGRFQREKTIAFHTASGQVTISLSAVEDLIRRLGSHLPEIKELRPDVIASKKGIHANLRVILKSEANIPELTARLQDIARAKIQEVLGIEEQIIIRIHVAKIIASEEKGRRKEHQKEDVLPYGYTRA